MDHNRLTTPNSWMLGEGNPGRSCIWNSLIMNLSTSWVLVTPIQMHIQILLTQKGCCKKEARFLTHFGITKRLVICDVVLFRRVRLSSTGPSVEQLVLPNSLRRIAFHQLITVLVNSK